MASQIADALNTSRTLAVKGDNHEAVAVLLRKRFQIKQEIEVSEDGQAQRTLQSAIDVLSQRIKPMLDDLSGNVFVALLIPEDASEADAKKAYRKLALRFHPDKSEGTTELFHCIQDAFERHQSGKNLKVSRGSSSFSSKGKDKKGKKGSTSGGSTSFTSSSSTGRKNSGPTPLQPPGNVRMTENTSTSITVAWDPPTGAASLVSCYELQFKEGDERDWHQASNSLTRTMCQKHNLKPGVSYRFRVRALNSLNAEWSPYSATCTASTMGSVPGRPNITRVATKSNLLCIEVHWEIPGSNNNNSPDKYILEWREKNKKMPWVQSDVSSEYESTVCNRIIRDLKVSKTYQFRVRAKNHVGCGPWSSIADSDPGKEEKRPNSASGPGAPRKLKIQKQKQLPNRYRTEDERLKLSSWGTWDAQFESLY